MSEATNKPNEVKKVYIVKIKLDAIKYIFNFPSISSKQ